MLLARLDKAEVQSDGSVQINFTRGEDAIPDGETGQGWNFPNMEALQDAVKRVNDYESYSIKDAAVLLACEQYFGFNPAHQSLVGVPGITISVSAATGAQVSVWGAP